MHFFLLVFLLPFAHATLPVWRNLCTADTDCDLSLGVCAHGLGDGYPARCTCARRDPRLMSLTALAHELTFDRTLWRCEPFDGWIDVHVPDQVYGEQEQMTTFLLQPRGRLPTNWTCDTTNDFCRAVTEELEWTVFDRSEELMTNTPFPVEEVAWRCRNISQVPWVPVADLATDPHLDQAMRPLDQHCLTPEVYCGDHGTPDGEFQKCTCDSGWTGDRCRNLTDTSTLLFRDQVFRGAELGFAYNFSRPCTSDADCGAHEHCYSNGSARVCWCREAHTIHTNLVDDCWPEPADVLTGVRLGVHPALAFDAVFDSEEGRHVWFRNAHLEFFAYNEFPLAAGDATARIDTHHVFLWRCLASAVPAFIQDAFDFTSRNTSDYIELCDSCARACTRWPGGAGACTQKEENVTETVVVNVTDENGTVLNTTTTENVTGTTTFDACACTNEDRFMGLFCESCVSGFAYTGCALPFTNCSNDNCHEGVGDCNTQGFARCDCPSPRFAEDCSRTQQNCTRERCSGNGLCTRCKGATFQPFPSNESAVSEHCCACFDDQFGNACNLTVDECRDVRCNARGGCTGDLQGCDCDLFWDVEPGCRVRNCLNEGVLLESNQCDCTREFFGVYCEQRTCGRGVPAASYDADDKNSNTVLADRACRCQDGFIYDTSFNCTRSSCGSNGAPNITTKTCDCDDGFVQWRFSTFLARTGTTELVTCGLPCKHGVWLINQEVCGCDAYWLGALCDRAEVHAVDTFSYTGVLVSMLVLVMLSCGYAWFHKTSPPLYMELSPRGQQGFRRRMRRYTRERWPAETPSALRVPLLPNELFRRR